LAPPCSSPPTWGQTPVTTRLKGLSRSVAGSDPTCIVLAVALCVSVACGHKAEEEGESATVPTIVADTGTVARRTLIEETTVRGAITARPNEDVKVSALVPGRVMSVTVAEGDAVRQGQVVASIDRRPIEEQHRQAAAALEQANAQIENAKANLDRMTQLFTKGIAAGKEVEDAKTQMASATAAREQATATLNTANLQLERTEVRTPIGGQVVKRMVSVGEQVDGTAGQPIVEIANLDRVEMAANVPADYLSRVKVNQRALISTAALPGVDLMGAVIAIAPAVDPATNTTLVRIGIGNADRQLRVGMFAEARLQLAEHPNVLVVPPPALVKNDEGTFVYVVTGNVAQRTPVMIGLETQTGVEIRSGVNEGQMVLTSSVYGLGDKATLASPEKKGEPDEKAEPDKKAEPEKK
jgi:membrane fusion protein, multidrug efflux system